MTNRDQKHESPKKKPTISFRRFILIAKRLLGLVLLALEIATRLMELLK